MIIPLPNYGTGFEFEQKRWDKKIEIDSNAGKLDFLINAALAEHHAGKTKSL